MSRLIVTSLLVFGCAANVLGHEGHGTPNEGHTLKHFLLEPIHLPLILTTLAAIIAASALLARHMRNRRKLPKNLAR